MPLGKAIQAYPTLKLSNEILHLIFMCEWLQNKFAYINKPYN